jgi:hypothetical protein
LTDSSPGPAEIFEHYLRSTEAIRVLKASLRDDPASVEPRSRFYGMIPVEVDEAIREMTRELEKQVVLLLVASAEAALRVDFLERVRARRKAPVSRGLRTAAAAVRPRRVKLETILGVWDEKTEDKDRALHASIERMKKLLHYRHWLAHGRYWVENKSGLNHPDPDEAWRILARLFNALSGFEVLPPF